MATINDKTTIAVTKETVERLKNLRKQMKLANPALSIRKDLSSGQIVAYALDKLII